jgi:hypothetical protein
MQLIIHTVNMGSAGSKKKKRLNRDTDKKQMCKVGLTMRWGDTNVEGCLKTEYHGKTRKKYLPVKGKLPTIEEEPIDFTIGIKDD